MTSLFGRAFRRREPERFTLPPLEPWPEMPPRPQVRRSAPDDPDSRTSGGWASNGPLSAAYDPCGAGPIPRESAARRKP